MVDPTEACKALEALRREMRDSLGAGWPPSAASGQLVADWAQRLDDIQLRLEHPGGTLTQEPSAKPKAAAKERKP